MYRISRLWWIPGIITCILSFFNPYVGLFSLFSIVGVFITMCFMLNLKANANEYVYSGSELIRKTVKVIGTVTLVVSGVMMGLSCVVEVVIYLLAYSGITRGGVPTVMTPVDLFSDSIKSPLSLAFLIFSIFLKILMEIMVVISVLGYKNGKFATDVNEEYKTYQPGNRSYLVFDIVCIAVAVVCGIVRSMDYDYSFIAFFDAFWLPFELMIFEILRFFIKKSRDSRYEFLRMRGQRMSYEVSAGHLWNNLLVIAALCTVVAQLLSQLTLHRADGMFHVSINGAESYKHIFYFWGKVALFPEGTMWGISIAAEVVCLSAFVIRYRRQQ